MFKVHLPTDKPAHQHGNANYAEITDGGHLVLLARAGNPREVVAVYAPDSWAYAEHIKPAAS